MVDKYVVHIEGGGARVWLHKIHNLPLPSTHDVFCKHFVLSPLLHPRVKEIITNSFHLEICLLANQLHLNTRLSISLQTTPFSFINLFYVHLIIDLLKSFCKITTFLSKPTLTRLCCSSGEFVITKINYNRHHELVDRYKISIFQMAMYLYLFT